MCSGFLPRERGRCVFICYATRIFVPVALALLVSLLLVVIGSVNATAQTFTLTNQLPRLTESDFVAHQVIVCYQFGVKAAERSALRADLNASLVRDLRFIGAELLAVPEGDVLPVVEKFRNDPRVKYIEPNYRWQAFLVPNDPSFPSQWGLNNTGQSGGTSDADIDAVEAWDITTGTTVIVGDIDTGVDTAHVDLHDNLWRNPGEIANNLIDDDNNGYVDDIHGWDFVNWDNGPIDDYGHGTHTSGTVAALGNNAVGVTGVCWSAKIMALKFLGSDGYGSTEDAILAIEYATMMGAQLTNNSWGGGPYSDALRDAIDSSGAHGMLFVASAGNYGENSDLYPQYPAAYDLPNIISVAATDHSDQVAWFSNFGATSVDLGAPGVNILSTIPGNSYYSAEGTSMAAPHVSGAAALVWSVYPHLSQAEVKQRILMMVDSIPALQGRCVTGGRLNLFMALSQPDSIAPAPVTDLAPTLIEATRVTLAWTATGDDSLAGQASLYDLRFATFPIDSGNFLAANKVPNVPRPGALGSAESFRVVGLHFQTTYFFALRVSDEWGNRSQISNLATATTIGPPQISVSPRELADSLFSFDTSSQTLTIADEAEGELFYEIDIDYPESPVAAGRIGGRITRDAFAGQLEYSAPQGSSDLSLDYDITGDRLAGSARRVLLVYADMGSVSLSLILDAYDDIEIVDSWYAGDYYSGTIPPLSVLEQYDVVVAWNNEAWVDQYAIGDVLADYIDVGGAVVTTVDCWGAGSFASYGRYFTTPGYCPFVSRGGALFASRTLGWYDQDHPIMEGVEALAIAEFYNNVNLSADASLVASWDDGTPLAAYNRRTVSINVWPGDYTVWSGDFPTLIHNAIIYAAEGGDWLTVEPRDGEVAPFSSTELAVSFNAAGLFGGDYHADLRVRSNDPEDSVLIVPVDLHVTGAPNISLEIDSLDFQNVFVNYADTLLLEIRNSGTDTLYITSLTFSSPEFSSDVPTLAIPPDDEASVGIIFAPLGSGAHSAQLEIGSNDTDQPIYLVSLTGFGLIPPEISVFPTIISRNMPTGGTDSTEVIISNQGGSSLDFYVQLETEGPLSQYTRALIEGISPDIGSLERDGGGAILTPDDRELLRVRFEAFRQSPAYLTLRGYMPRIGVAGDYPYDVIYLLLADTAIAPYYLIEPVLNYEDFVSIQDYDGLIVAEWDYGISELEAVSLSMFNRAHNPIIMMMDDLDDEPASVQNLLEPIFGIGQAHDGDFYFGELNDANPITQGVSYVNSFCCDNDWYTLDGADWVLRGSDGNPYFVSYQGSTRSCLAGEHFTSVHYGSPLLCANAIRWCFGGGRWLNVTPFYGTVPPGSEITLTAVLDAKRLQGGLYRGDITVFSNDPARPAVDIAAILRVSAAPDIFASPDTLEFDTLFVTTSQSKSIEIRNQGTAVLSVDSITITDASSSDAAFTIDSGGFWLEPDSSLIIAVTFAPPTDGLLTADLVVNSNDPDDARLHVKLRGFSQLPPDIDVDSDSLSANLFTGQQTEEEFRITNDGGSPLEFSIRLGRAEELLRLAQNCLLGVQMTGQRSGPDGTAPVFTEAELELFVANLARYREQLSESAVGRTAPLIGICGQDQYNLAYYLLADSLLASLYQFEIVNDYSSLDSVREFDGLIVNYYYGGPTLQQARVLQGFSGFGRGVVLGTDDLPWLEDSVRVILFDVFGITGSTDGFYSGGAPNPDHPISEGISYVGYLCGDNNRFTLGTADWIIGTGPDSYFGVANESPFRAVLYGCELTCMLWYGTGSHQLLVNSIEWAVAGPGWLSVAPGSDTVLSNKSRDVIVTFNSEKLPGGDYAAEILVSSNDPDEPLVTVAAHLVVVGAPDISLSDVALNLGTVIIGADSADTIDILNDGTEPLTITLTVENTAFGIPLGSFMIEPGENAALPVTFTPIAPGPTSGSLRFVTDDPDESDIRIELSGTGIEPPVITVAPLTIQDSLLSFETSTHLLTVANSGVADLYWRIEIEDSSEAELLDFSPPYSTSRAPAAKEADFGPTFQAPQPSELHTFAGRFGSPSESPVVQDNEPLEQVLESLNEEFLSVTARIPNRYDFSEGVTNYYISDGGDDMYDGGNYLETEFGGWISYSDDAVVPSSYLGNMGRYFTRKYPGLWVFVADFDGPRTLTINGNLGADGGGLVDGAVIELALGGKNFLGFIKRVYDAGNPSVNHLVIVESTPDVAHTFSTYSNDDYHSVYNLPTSARVYYLLYAGSGGSYIDNDETIAIMEAFLKAAGLGPGFVSVDPDAGIVVAGSSESISVNFNSDDLFGGMYAASLRVFSNDPANAEIAVAASLYVTGVPRIEVSRDSLDFARVFVGQSALDTITVANTGTDTLIIADCSVADADFTASPVALLLPPDSQTVVTIVYAPTTSGSHNTELVLHSNDFTDSVHVLQLFATAEYPPILGIDPSSFLDSLMSGDSVQHSLTISNAGVADLVWDLEIEETGSSMVMASHSAVFSASRPTDPKVSDSISARQRPDESDIFSSSARGTGMQPGDRDMDSVSLEFVLAALDADHEQVAGRIPNRYDFSEGESGYYIYDGGDNMYNYGNYLGTSSYWGIPYSEGVVISSYAFGSGSRYFTRKYPGLWVLAADTRAMPYFDIGGSLGAGGSGAVDGSLLQVEANGKTFSGIVKRVYGAGTPSVNHLIIIDQSETFGYGYSTYSGDDYHFVDQIQFTQRLYYLLFAGSQGAYVDDAAMLSIMKSFLHVTEGASSFIAVTPESGTTPGGSTSEITVTLEAAELIVGNYSGEIRIVNNDPLNSEPVVPVALHVTGVPSLIVSSDSVDVGDLFVGQTRFDSLLVTNLGTDTLKVTSMTSTDAAFTATPLAFELFPEQSQSVLLRFQPSAAGSYDVNLTIHNNDPNDSAHVVTLLGYAEMPPIIGVQPDSLLDTLLSGESAAQTLTISNTGVADLSWHAVLTWADFSSILAVSPRFAASGQAAQDKNSPMYTPQRPPTDRLYLSPPQSGPQSDAATNRGQSTLEGIRAALESGYVSISSQIPNRFDFSEGESGDAIVDGGNDMYDWGNSLSSGLGGYLEYTNGPILSSPYLGTDGRYFTRKYPGLFVCVADLDSVEYFQVSGNLGADNLGLVDGSTIGLNVLGREYLVFVKRVYNAYDPSVNHLFILEARAGLAHEFANVTDDDYHRVTGLATSGRLHYLLFAGSDGSYIDDQHCINIADAYVRAARLAPGFVTISPESGVTQAGSSSEVQVSLDADDALCGLYRAAIEVESNDPITPEVSIPVSLVVIGVPQIAVSSDTINFGTGFVGGLLSQSVAITNVGTDSLEVFAIESDLESMTITPSSFTLPIDGRQVVSVSLQPTEADSIRGIVTIHSNDANDASHEVQVLGQVVLPPEIAVDPDSLFFDLLAGQSDSAELTISNGGYSPLEFSIRTRAAAALPARSINQATNWNYAPDVTAGGPAPPDVVLWRTPEYRADRSSGAVPLLLVQDALPWGGAANEEVLASLGIAYDRINSGSLALTDLSEYQVVLVAGDQPHSFYEELRAVSARINDFVASGGILEFHACAGWNGGSPEGLVLPGGALVVHDYWHSYYYHYVIEPSHALAAGLGSPFYGYFTNDFRIDLLPPGANKIITGNYDYVNELAEYSFGSGRVIVSSLMLEYGYIYSSLPGVVLLNMISYSVRGQFVPWLSVDPGSGTVVPDSSLAVSVNVATTGLGTGEHQAELVVMSNDPLAGSVVIPVGLSVEGRAAIDVEPTEIDFGNSLVGHWKNRWLLVISIGSEILSVSSISVGGSSFVTSDDHLTVPPGVTAEITISFYPDQLGDFVDTLRIECNDPENPVVLVPLSGRGVDEVTAPDTCRFYVRFPDEILPDSGLCDTIRVGCRQVVPIIIEGDSIAVPIYYWGDVALGGFSLGFFYSSDYIEFSSWSTQGGIIPVASSSLNLVAPRPADNQVLLGWLDLSGGQYSIPRITEPVAQLLGTLYLKILGGAPAHTIDLDSVFVPPAGVWATIKAHGTLPLEISPLYDDCGLHDIYLGMIPEGNCGDTDGNDIVNISDAVFLINYVFGGGPAPNPHENGDVDCNGIITISDAVFLISYVFGGGPVPCAACQ